MPRIKTFFESQTEIGIRITLGSVFEIQTETAAILSSRLVLSFLEKDSLQLKLCPLSKSEQFGMWEAEEAHHLSNHAGTMKLRFGDMGVMELTT
ncbi:hypothetical protein AAC387_Pa10g0925 [Persea americana]